MNLDSSLENAILVLSKFKNDKSAVRFAGSVGRTKFSVDGIIEEFDKKLVRVRGASSLVSVELSRARFSSIAYFEPREIPEEFRTEDFASFWHFTLTSGDFFIVAEFPPRK